jgi:hypothetical protein
MMDVPHPDDGWMKIPMLPQVGKFGAKIDDMHPAYPWFFAFQQVKGLPERLLEGRTDIYLNFCVDYSPRTLPRLMHSIEKSTRRNTLSVPGMPGFKPFRKMCWMQSNTRNSKCPCLAPRRLTMKG